MTTGGYTGMNAPTIGHYQDVIGRLNQYAQGGNIAQPQPQPQPTPVYTPQVYPNAVQPMNYAANVAQPMVYASQPMAYASQPMAYASQPMGYDPNFYSQVMPMQNTIQPGTFMPSMLPSFGFGGPGIPPPSAISMINNPEIALGQNALRGLLS